jgi:peptidyl-prolyl cis-trans isomerase A (cyclophilin A)
MIQGGGFETNLAYKTPGESILNESSNRLSNVRGTIAMARTSYPDTASSQFFINIVNNNFLDYGYIAYDYNYSPPKQLPAQVGYCVFGEVVIGMTVVDAIAAVATQTETNTDGQDMQNVPINDIIIQSATITQNIPVCAEKLEGDVDGNCRVNFADFVKMAQNWLACNSLTDACQ